MKKLLPLTSFLTAALLLLVMLAPPSIAQVVQEWVARYDGPELLGWYDWDEPEDIAVDQEGNTYVTGRSNNNEGNCDYATVKYSSEGDTLWTARCNGPDNLEDRPVGLALDPENRLVVTGKSMEATYDYTILTIKYNSIGDTLWQRRYRHSTSGDNEVTDLVVDNIGNIYLTRSTCLLSPAFNDYCTLKYDPAGSLLWVMTFDAPTAPLYSLDYAKALAVSATGNVYVTGYGRVGSDPVHYNAHTIKYNSAGVQQWTAEVEGVYAGCQSYHIVLDEFENVYVAGRIWDDSMSGYNYMTVKYNSNGVQQWLAVYNSTNNGDDFTNDLALDQDNNILVTGSSTTPYVTEIATLKYNSSGQQQWLAIFNGVGTWNWVSPEAMALDSAGNIYVTGCYFVQNYQADYLTVKYSPSGTQLWVVTYDNSLHFDDIAKAITTDNAGNVYVTGWSMGAVDDIDYATIKYSQSAPAPVSITMSPINPPINIPSTGGSFNYNVSVSNNSTTPQSFSAWIMVQLPDSTWYGPVLGPLALTLPAGANLSRQRTQNVPASAPAGNYLYEGRVGVYPDSIWDEDSFPFTKLGVDELGLWQQDWTNTGESFEEIFVGAQHVVPLPPTSFAVSVNPNPFNASTIISFELGAASEVKLEVFDIKGERVGVGLVPTRLHSAGAHQIPFDGSNLPSGIYLYHLQAGTQAITGKMILLK